MAPVPYLKMYYPSKEEFKKLAKDANVIPVYREIQGDILTPVSAFLKLKSDYSYLLESVEGEEKIARFSFIGIEPSLIFRSKDNKVEMLEYGKHRQFFTDSPLDELKRILKDFRPAQLNRLPRFSGGLVGFMGYDMVRFFERLPNKNPDELGIDDSIFIMADSLIIFDHSRHTIKLLSNAYLSEDRHPSKSNQVNSNLVRFDQSYENATRKIDELANILTKPLLAKSKRVRKNRPSQVKSNFTKNGFQDIVKHAKKYIKYGDIIQVVLSQRFQTRIECEPFEVYRALRSLNPSPYMYYLNFGDIKMIGSSPELLVRCENGIVETRPIAGTRRRGKDELEDKKLEKELLSDAKERAEHVMLVDLGRNDIGRVCKSGSVKVTDFMFIERYSHVMHIVSNCKGELREDKTSYDVLKAAFPAGTVTGAPKVRAMEIIDELENLTRGPYAGAVGYFSFSGNMDTCINIRTILVKEKTAYIQAGAGIVADSVPEREYQESVNKAKAMLKAIEIAEKREQY